MCSARHLSCQLSDGSLTRESQRMHGGHDTHSSAAQAHRLQPTIYWHDGDAPSLCSI